MKQAIKSVHYLAEKLYTSGELSSLFNIYNYINHGVYLTTIP